MKELVVEVIVFASLLSWAWILHMVFVRQPDDPPVFGEKRKQYQSEVKTQDERWTENAR